MIDPSCGGPAGPERNTHAPHEPAAETVGRSVTLCPDGKYRWIYEVSLLKNPTVFLLIWKILFFIFLGIFAVVLLADARYFMDRLADNLKFLGWFLVGMTAVTGLGYLLYAAIMGGKYVVLFEMDEKGVNHKQVASQAKKARTLAAAAAAAGMAAGSLTAAGAGLGAARTEMYTDFSRVRKVKALPRRHVIKLAAGLEHNQVYAPPADFDFVKDHILSHCDRLKRGN